MSEASLVGIALCCPYCHTELQLSDASLVCVDCHEAYPLDPVGNVPDLRLPRSKSASIDVVVLGADSQGPPETIDVLEPCSSPEVDWSGFRPPRHLDPALMSYIQRPSAPGALALDLGCGDGEYRDAIEHAGYRWLGIDILPGHASVVGDAQALPFADDTFDAIISLAVLEHIQHPLVFAREAYRVLRPGRSIVGSAAFLEPLHGESFYHHTHRGLWNTLSSAGFQVRMIAASPRWTVLRAQSSMALFPQMPGGIATALVMPLQGAHRLWWWVASLTGKDRASRALRLSTTAGSLHFVATKPVAEAAHLAQP